MFVMAGAVACMGCAPVAMEASAATSSRDGSQVRLAPTKYKPAPGAKLERAIVAGGCFWGTEYHFRHLDGVTATAVGYIGGKTKNPTYEDVCSHTTGHAEAVMVEFDTAKLTYAKVLEQHWQTHNPTTLNRQGPDFGDNYRSAIFTLSDDQMKVAEKSKADAQKMFNKPIVTQIAKAPTFWMAEDYHQQYAEKTGRNHCPIDRSNHIGG